MASPTVEDLLQQLILGQQKTMERIDVVVVQSTNINTRIDEVLKRVEDIELAQSLAQYPTSVPEEGLNPLLLNTKRSTQRSKASSPTNSEADDKESSIANPGNKEDLAAVLDAAADTPVLTKRRSTPDHQDCRDS